MNKREITKTVVLMIFVNLIFWFISVKSESNKIKHKEFTQLTGEQDSLIKSEEFINYLKPEPDEQTRGVIINKEKQSPMQLKNVAFDYNSAELTVVAREQLDELGEALQSEELSGVSIKLAGHTDLRGSEDYNLKLSQRRVESAKNYIVRNYHIKASRIYEIGYGKSSPIIRYARTEAEHSVNRRVEISPWEKNFEKNEIENISDDRINKTRLEWGVFHVKDNNSHELINGNSALKTKDKYRIYVKPPTTCYVYIYQEDSNGNGIWLFPHKDSKIKNPLNSGDNWIPSRDEYFSLDKNIGTETIYLVASNNTDPDLENIIAKPKTQKEPPPQPPEITFKIKMRSEEKMRGAQIIMEDNSEGDINVVDIKNKNWDFYVELKFKHE